LQSSVKINVCSVHVFSRTVLSSYVSVTSELENIVNMAYILQLFPPVLQF
jgi:hypothetical protein